MNVDLPSLFLWCTLAAFFLVQHRRLLSSLLKFHVKRWTPIAICVFVCSWSYNFIPVSHAPPVGSYNIFDGKKKSGPASFDKSKRFDDLKGNRVFDNNLSVKLRLQILASSWYSSTEAKLYGWRKGNTFNTEFSLIIVGFNPYVDSLTTFLRNELVCALSWENLGGRGGGNYSILFFTSSWICIKTDYWFVKDSGAGPSDTSIPHLGKSFIVVLHFLMDYWKLMWVWTLRL